MELVVDWGGVSLTFCLIWNSSCVHNEEILRILS
jgi:hypothetical protein